jgi:nucleoside-diphosphate-sugar epimerase
MRLLLTGGYGFTGLHITQAAKAAGFTTFSLRANLCDYDALDREVKAFSPTHVIHLAAISDVTSADSINYYQINLFGTLNLLRSLEGLNTRLDKIILASSANIYGNNATLMIPEEALAHPVSHYAMSKLSMELMTRSFLESLPIIYTRPFNYTGVGHDQRFVIPKLIAHFCELAPSIQLGNLDVRREYNDVRDVARIYLSLLSKGINGEAYNICTGKTFTLSAVIAMLKDITCHDIEVHINPDFVRRNDIQILSGNPAKLEACIGQIEWHQIRETLEWMLSCSSTRGRSPSIL